MSAGVGTATTLLGISVRPMIRGPAADLPRWRVTSVREATSNSAFSVSVAVAGEPNRKPAERLGDRAAHVGVPLAHQPPHQRFADGALRGLVGAGRLRQRVGRFGPHRRLRRIEQRHERPDQAGPLEAAERTDGQDLQRHRARDGRDGQHLQLRRGRRPRILGLEDGGARHAGGRRRVPSGRRATGESRDGQRRRQCHDKSRPHAGLSNHLHQGPRFAPSAVSRQPLKADPAAPALPEYSSICAVKSIG